MIWLSWKRAACNRICSRNGTHLPADRQLITGNYQLSLKCQTIGWSNDTQILASFDVPEIVIRSKGRYKSTYTHKIIYTCNICVLCRFQCCWNIYIIVDSIFYSSIGNKLQILQNWLIQLNTRHMLLATLAVRIAFVWLRNQNQCTRMKQEWSNCLENNNYITATDLTGTWGIVSSNDPQIQNIPPPPPPKKKKKMIRAVNTKSLTLTKGLTVTTTLQPYVIFIYEWW